MMFCSSRRRQSIQVDRREYASNLGTAGGSKATRWEQRGRVLCIVEFFIMAFSFLPKVRFILRARYYELFDLVDVSMVIACACKCTSSMSEICLILHRAGEAMHILFSTF